MELKTATVKRFQTHQGTAWPRSFSRMDAFLCTLLRRRITWRSPIPWQSDQTGFKDTPTQNSEKRSMHRWSGVYWSWMPMWMLLDPTAWVQLSLHVLEATHQSLQRCQRLVVLKDSFEKAVWKKVWNCQVWDQRLWSCPARALQSWGLAQCKRSERHQAWNASLYASHGQSFEEASVIFSKKKSRILWVLSFCLCRKDVGRDDPRGSFGVGEALGDLQCAVDRGQPPGQESLDSLAKRPYFSAKVRFNIKIFTQNVCEHLQLD